jgi:hypothetical protein
VQGQTGVQGYTGYQGVTGTGTGLKIKAGVVAAASFAGNPKEYTVTFVNAMPSSSYAIVITGQDERSWSYTSRTASGFIINANANAALTNDVSWTAISTGESN